jgi:heme/copper-type cytochrome/quinol oxidase subunit 1
LELEDWRHKKAEENAHNEILAFLMLVLGVNLLMGGLLVTIVVRGEPSSLLSLPYMPLQVSPARLGSFLVIVGFVVLVAGFTLVVHYHRKKAWYRKKIEKSSLLREKIVPKSVDELLEEYTGKRKKR